MFKRVLSRTTYANVMATLAFFIALSGTSYAAFRLPANSVGDEQIRPLSVGDDELQTASVGSRHLKPESVGSGHLKPQSVGQRHLKLRSVGNINLKALSVGTEKLRPDSVTEDQLAPNAVGPKSLQGNAVGSDQLAPNSVGSREMKPGSLTYDVFDVGQVSPRLFAHMSSSGTLGVSAGVVSAGRVSKGTYEFTFNRDLHGCVPVANVGFGHGPGVIGAGGTAQSSLFGNSGVRVTVYRKGFTFNDVEDNDVNLIVVC